MVNGPFAAELSNFSGRSLGLEKRWAVTYRLTTESTYHSRSNVGSILTGAEDVVVVPWPLLRTFCAFSVTSSTPAWKVEATVFATP